MISIDSGSSYLKAFDGKREVWFPAVVIGLDPGEHSPEAIHVGGKGYLVGEPALNFRTDLPVGEPDRERDYHGSDRQYVQMCRALAELGVPDGSYDRLLVSLPYLAFQEAGMIEAVGKRTQFRWQDHKGPHSVDFYHVVATPQGVGALRLHERECSDPLERAMLVDIGSCTTDVVTVWRSSKGWSFYHDACTSLQNISTTTFFRAWLEDIRKMRGFAEYAPPYHRLMDRAIRGRLSISHFGERVSVEDSYQRVCKQFTRDLRKAVEGVAKSQWPELEQVILTGGGACLIEQDAFDDPRLRVLGIHANAQGQYHFHNRDKERAQCADNIT